MLKNNVLRISTVFLIWFFQAAEENLHDVFGVKASKSGLANRSSARGGVHRSNSGDESEHRSKKPLFLMLEQLTNR